MDLALRERVVPLLIELAALLAKVDRHTGAKKRDPFIWRAALILSISSGLAINGGVHLVRKLSTDFPVVVDDAALLYFSVLWAIGIVAALVFVAIVALGSTARTHLVLIELVLVGSFGAFTTAWVGRHDINIEWDREPATVYTAKVLGKHCVGRRQGNCTYYLLTDGWPGRDFGEEIKVSSDVYSDIAIGKNIRIRQKPGYLGYRWVEDISAAP
jgi:hypothetical protein